MKQNAVFIGREDTLADFRKEVFFASPEDYGSCAALCGPHGIGKTYLINKLMSEFESAIGRDDDKKAYCFYTSVRITESEDPLLDFKIELLRKISQTILIERVERSLATFDPNSFKYTLAQKNLKHLRKAYNTVSRQEIRRSDDPEYDGWRMEVNECFEADMPASVFRIFTEMGYRVILILDEFDRASSAFPSGDIYQWLFSLSDKGGRGLDLNLSIIVVSRRRPALFVGKMDDGSDFESAFKPTVMYGFTDQELDGEKGYFESFPEDVRGLLTDKVKRRILYYCGRHPALLMEMRKKILANNTGGEIDIDALWQREPSFKRVYEKMCAQMESDKVPFQADETLIDAFIYRFVYFASRTTSSNEAPDQEMYLDRLVDAGFAMRPDWSKNAVEEKGKTLYPDIFYRAGQKEKKTIEKPLLCEPLSPYFLVFIENRWKPQRGKGAAQHLGWTERALRTYIEGKVRAKYKEYWGAAVKAAFSQNPDTIRKIDNFMKANKEVAQANNYTGELSNLDVLSFENYYTILEYFWSTFFQNDFANYGTSRSTPLFELKNDFDFLYTCRNAKAHENLFILSTESLRRVEKVCSKLDAIIESSI